MCRLLIFRHQTTATLLSQSGAQITEPWYSTIAIVSLSCPYNVAFSFRNMQHPSCSHSRPIYRRCRFRPKEEMPFLENQKELTHLFCLNSPSLLYAGGKLARAEQIVSAALVWKFCHSLRQHVCPSLSNSHFFPKRTCIIWFNFV